MLDVDTFLTTLYVIVDDFRQSCPQEEERHPRPEASLNPSEIVTLAIFARWSRFASERDFYRYASSRLRDAFPTLPDRSVVPGKFCNWMGRLGKRGHRPPRWLML